jgi:hypothetical protein
LVGKVCWGVTVTIAPTLGPFAGSVEAALLITS